MTHSSLVNPIQRAISLKLGTRDNLQDRDEIKIEDVEIPKVHNP